MADVESNIHVNIDTSDALASLKLLQRQISAFHTQMAKSGTAAAAVAANQAQNLMNSINATGQFQASMRSVTTSTEHFTDSLERNKLTSREYFRYTGAATKTFGRLFKSEFETLNKVARERVKDIQTQYIKLGRGANGALQAIAVRPLTLDMKNLGTQTAIAAQRQQLLNQLLKQGSTNLLNFGKNTQWAGRQLMVGFTVPLAMLGATASKTFMQLEEQAIRFKRVYGEMFTSQEETDAMVKQIQTLAKEYTKYGVAVEDTMKMAADAAAMGKQGAALTAQVVEATRLAVLGGVEQTQALETTISVTNAFGVATEDLAKKIDFLNAVENQTVVSIEDLTIAIPKAGPVVQQLGGDVEDLAFFLTAMKEGGINASEGANALKSGLASLINPSKKASAFLGDLGVNITGIVEANKGDIKATVVGFAQALDTLDPLNRARAIEQLFGKFQFSRLSTLFQNVTAEGTQAQRVLELTQATTEELAILSQRELDKIQNTTTYKFKKSMEDLKVAIAPVGEQFLKALTPIVEFVGKVLDKFNNLGDGSKKFLTILTVAVAGVGPILLMTFGLIANAAANIIKLFAGMKSMYNRTGNASKVLGDQTNYLTKEQIEASAVAASLDQVHQKLKQTFTSETTAVNMLANAYRRAIAAQAGFTGPPAGKRMPKLKKYSTGTTRVPGTGNKDTVPSVLTPGEAVIPQKAAQDPANRPFIAHMVAGGTVQGFNEGTEEVTKDGRKKVSRTVFAHATEPQKLDSGKLPAEFADKSAEFKARGIEKALGYRGLGFDISEEVHKALTQKTPVLDVRAYEAEIRKPGAVLTMTSKLMDPPLSLSAGEAGRVANSIRGNLLTSLAALPDGFKINDPMVYSRMGNTKTGILGGLARDPKMAKAIERIYAIAGVGGASKAQVQYDRKQIPIDELIEKIKKDGPKTNPSVIKAIEDLKLKAPGTMVSVRTDADGKLLAYERPEVSGKKDHPGDPNKWVITDKKNNGALLGDRFATGRSKGETGAVKIGGTASAASRKAAMAYLQNVVGEVTSYGPQVSKGTGYSNRAARNASGVFETADGRGKVYVKPMMDLQSALAEQRATQIAREVHGLDSPEQKLRIVKDPVTKKTMYALESPYDPKFDPSKMSNTFTKEEYIRQNVAAALRADKDLGRGNLSGNILADVGPAGVFSTASGQRSFAESLPSMEEQARINLDIEEKNAGRKKFFSQATVDHARSFKTAELYEKAMKDEINRVLPKLRETVAKFDLAPDESKAYKAMVKRLEGGLNADWKDIWKRHTSIVVKPGELIQNTQTGEIKKPKTKRKPGSVKSSSGKPVDTLLAPPLKDNERVVQGKPPRRGAKGVVLPGFADAPHINITDEMLDKQKPGSVKRLADPASAIVAGAKASIAEAKAVGSTIGTTLSQSASAASRTLLYGTGPVDAEAKSVRRRLQKMQREEAKTQSKIAASKTKLYGTGPIDADAKSLRRQMEKRSKLANSVGYPKQVIQSQPSAPVGPLLPSGNFVANRKDKLGLKARAAATRMQGRGGAVTAGVGIAAGATMIGSMAPGKVGEMSQKLMMPLMGLSMVLPMLKSPIAAVAVGLAATVGSFVALRMAFDSAANKVLEENEKFRGSTSAVNAIAKFSGKVTASEQMDLKRKNSFNMTPSATGKTTYGEAYVQTSEGKAITKRLAEQNAAGKGGQAVGDLSSQLTTSIMSGALNMDQAKSLALNAAREAGDVSMGIRVIAQMEKILGPNGEDLEKDPLRVRTDMVAANRKRLETSANNVNNASGLTKLAGQKTVQMAGIGASAAGGAAIGATIGAALGSVVPILGNAVGAIIGGGIGAAAGAIGGYFASKRFAKQAGALGAAYAVDAKIAMEQNKQMLDSFDMYMAKKVEELRLQGKINEANELQEKLIDKRNTLTDAQRAMQEDVVSQYNNAGGMQEAMMSGMKKATTARYKDDPNQLAYVDVVNQQAANLQKDGLIDSGQEFLIQAKMASGDIPPSVFRSLLGLAADNKDIAPKMMNIITKFSGATSESIGVAAQNILDAKGVVNKTVQTKFVTKVEAFEKDSDALDFTKNMIKLNNLNEVIPSDVLVSYYSDDSAESKAAYEKLNTALDGFEAAKTIDLPLVYQLLPEVKGTDAFNEEYFNSLKTDAEKRTYVTTIASVVNLPDPVIQASQDFIDWQKSPTTMIQGQKYGGAEYASLPISQQIAHYKEDQGFKAVTEGVSTDSTAAPVVPTGGGGSKTESSPLDDLVKKLRDVRKNQIKVTEGWSASRKALDGLFGGKKTIDVFSGIENDIRKLGGSQDFIELIVGMDPKEYEKRKNSLFKFDNKGNIVGLKKDAKNIQEAMNSIAMGDWNSSMEAESTALNDQAKAFGRIEALGVPVANAYELITDKTIAQAIANGVNDKTLKTLINRYKGLTAAQEKSAAIQATKTDIAQFKKDRVQEDRIRKQYSSETAVAIGSDENLKAMENAIAAQQSKVNSLVSKGADRKTIVAAQGELNSMITDFNTRLTQLKNTVGFMQDMFDNGFSNAMEAFDVQETALNIQFKLDTKSKDTIIKEAQDQIAAIQYKVDDKEAALKAIEDQEQKINEKYDERIKALDEVEKANASIANQQRGQLTLAEALTSGDIAAAARAAQDMRAQQAADAVTKQKDAVEQSRQYELDGLTAIDKTDGKLKSRKQLEQEIKTLQDEVFKIEEDKIEPAQEFIRLRQIQLDKDVEGLTVLGKTRDAWEAIKNQVDLAMINSKKFIESMQLAISTKDKLISGYNNEQAGGNDAIVGAAYSSSDPAITAATAAATTAATAAATTAATTASTATAATQNVGNIDAVNKTVADQTKVLTTAIANGTKTTVTPSKIANDMATSLLADKKSTEALGGVAGVMSSARYTGQAIAYAAQQAAAEKAKDTAATSAALRQLTSGGSLSADQRRRLGMSTGGLVPKYFAAGGFARGTDTIPAMLTPGEFIMSKYAVDSYGVDNLRKINNGDATSGAVYNNTYALTVNAKTDSNPNEIAQAVMATIKQVDDRRIRGIGINGR